MSDNTLSCLQLEEEAWGGCCPGRLARRTPGRAGGQPGLAGEGLAGEGPSPGSWATRELQCWLKTRPHQRPVQVSPPSAPPACPKDPSPATHPGDTVGSTCTWPSHCSLHGGGWGLGDRLPGLGPRSPSRGPAEEASACRAPGPSP